MAGIVWSEENRLRLDNAIEEFGEDTEFPSYQIAKIVGVMQQTLSRWCKMAKHREALSNKGEVSVFITLGNFREFVESNLKSHGLTSYGKYTEFRDCVEVTKVTGGVYYIVVNVGDYFHHFTQGSPPSVGDIVTLVRKVNRHAGSFREINGKYTAWFMLHDLRVASKKRLDHLAYVEGNRHEVQ